MTDEKYSFIEDVREKKLTSRSVRNKRTHNGKGGKAKLPSDYMTKKELAAMSGECKTYRMNSPMRWAEFKSMPDELKADYIKAIQEKYNAPAGAIADMFGVHKSSVIRELYRLGFEGGKKGRKVGYDKEGFLAWANMVPIAKPAPVEEVKEEAQQEARKEESSCEKRLAIPGHGNMVFEGRVEDVLKSVSVLLGGANVHISVTWDVLEG